jgi:hypothetical protein
MLDTMSVLFAQNFWCADVSVDEEEDHSCVMPIPAMPVRVPADWSSTTLLVGDWIAFKASTHECAAVVSRVYSASELAARMNMRASAQRVRTTTDPTMLLIETTVEWPFTASTLIRKIPDSTWRSLDKFDRVPGNRVYVAKKLSWGQSDLKIMLMQHAGPDADA